MNTLSKGLTKVYEYADKMVGLSISVGAVPPTLNMVIRIAWLRIEVVFGNDAFLYEQ